jgi:hypothetical protein
VRASDQRQVPRATLGVESSAVEEARLYQQQAEVERLRAALKETKELMVLIYAGGYRTEPQRQMAEQIMAKLREALRGTDEASECLHPIIKTVTTEAHRVWTL